jgi:hypothetical protein
MIQTLYSNFFLFAPRAACRGTMEQDHDGFAARANAMTDTVFAPASKQTRAASEKVAPDVNTSSTKTTSRPATHPARAGFIAMEACSNFRRSCAV